MEKTNGEKEEDKQPIEKMRKRIVKGGLEREEAENRKHSVCKSQIKSISILHTKPCPGGYMGFSASYSEQVGRVRQPLLTFLPLFKAADEDVKIKALEQH